MPKITTFAQEISPQRNFIGVMQEWLNWLAWKACIRQKRIGGSNPPHSARRAVGMRTLGFVIDLSLSQKEFPSLRFYI